MSRRYHYFHYNMMSRLMARIHDFIYNMNGFILHRLVDFVGLKIPNKTLLVSKLTFYNMAQ